MNGGKASSIAFVFFSLLAVCLSFIFGSAFFHSKSGEGSVYSAEAKQLLKDGTVKHVIDVRTDVEWNLGHYPGAIHIPLQNLSADNEKLKSINKNDGILVYCQTGNRARTGAEKLKSFGYKNVYYLVGPYNLL